MDSIVRNRLIDLALRAKFAIDRFRELENRSKGLKDVKIKDETRTISVQLEKGLEKSQKILSEGDKATDQEGKTWIQATFPKVTKLEQANTAFGPALLNAETRKAIGEFKPETLPTESFVFRAGHTVTDPKLFKERLQTDIDAGPEGPRWRVGALFSDLRDLSEMR